MPSPKAAKARSELPFKYDAAAPEVAFLPTLGEAAAAFRQAFVDRRLPMVRRLNRGDTCVVVLAASIAVEYRNSTTLHLRLRPETAQWRQNLAQVLAWPEAKAWSRQSRLVGTDCPARVLAGLLNVFNAWARDILPTGYRYSHAVRALRFAFGPKLRWSRLEPRFVRALAPVFPQPLLDSLHLSIAGWLTLPDPVAPLRIWNQHRHEFNDHQAPDPWVDHAAGLLNHFPADLAPGVTLEQSLKRMVERVSSPAEWRFHRTTRFRFLPDVTLFDLEHGHPVVTAAVKALGQRGAIAFFDQLGEEAFVTMLVECMIRDRESGWSRMPIFVARAAAHLAQFRHPSGETCGEVTEVLAALLECGFSEGYPRKTSTWASLVRRAHTQWRPFELEPPHEICCDVAPRAWESPLEPWSNGQVTFTPLTTHDALRDEGRQMNHCVETWHSCCAAGSVVVFRVLGVLPSGDTIRATAGFRRRTGQAPWQLLSILGRSNTRVPAGLKAMARECERNCNTRALPDAGPPGPVPELN